MQVHTEHLLNCRLLALVQPSTATSASQTSNSSPFSTIKQHYTGSRPLHCLIWAFLLLLFFNLDDTLRLVSSFTILTASTPPIAPRGRQGAPDRIQASNLASHHHPRSIDSSRWPRIIQTTKRTRVSSSCPSCSSRPCFCYSHVSTPLFPQPYQLNSVASSIPPLLAHLGVRPQLVPSRFPILIIFHVHSPRQTPCRATRRHRLHHPRSQPHGNRAHSADRQIKHPCKYEPPART